MRISDWSSDVCSSDLPPGRAPGAGRRGARRGAGDAWASRGPGMSGLVIGDDHPALPGHFPGRPIVPGVVIVDRVLDAIEAAQGSLGALRLDRKGKRLHSSNSCDHLLPSYVCKKYIAAI